MTTDLYTKAVLTVIAIALSGIAIQMTTKNAYAQSGRFQFTESGALMVAQCEPKRITDHLGVWTNCLSVNGKVVKVGFN